MKLLDKYIFKKIISTFIFVVLILEAIICIIDLTEKMDKFVQFKLSKMVILSYYMDFIPWIAGFLSPITIFIAIIYVTSRMAAHTEIVAILGSGISFRRFLYPYFLAATVVAVMSFILNGWVIPKSNYDRLLFEMQYFQNKYYFEERNVHMQVAPNVNLFIQNYNNQGNTGYQFSLERFDQNRLVEKLSADNIVWDTVKMKWTLKMWKRKKIDSIFQVQKTSDIPLVEKGESLDTTLAITPKDFENNKKMYGGMTIPELTEKIETLRFRGSTGVEAYETERHIRYSSPFYIYVLVFMGAIVSARKSRGGTGFQIALGFLLAFIFILFFTIASTFAQTGALSPWLAAWLPNIVFGLITLLMYKYVPR
ncbi:MAG: LptF/LptG family permease [Cyclobacteriaceae bacterium]|jgi:lipopolysaccharide export system permease protein|nr:LptF/LptG family permease [Flammeovirgaceae bacterium]